MKVIPPINTTPPWLIEPDMLVSSTAPEPKPAAAAWVSGATYAVRDVCSRAANFREYRRRAAGAGTTPPESDAANWTDTGAYERAWVSGTTYASADECIVASIHRKFKRVGAGAGTTSPELDAANWLDIGPTNAWAMFDALRNSATKFTGAGPHTVVINPGKRINAIAIMGCEVSAITISVSVSGVVEYSRTTNMNGRNTVSWSGYYFGEFKFIPSLVLFDMPPYAGGIITITFALPATGVAAIGAIVIGTAVDIGSVQYGPEIDSLNFSKVDRDAYGGAILQPIRSVPKNDLSLVVEKAQINKIMALKNATDAVPCVYSGLDDKNWDGYFEAVLMLGVWKRFSFNLAYPDHAKISLQVEEI